MTSADGVKSSDTSGGGGGGGVVPPLTGLIDTSAACPNSIATSGFGDLSGLDENTIQAIDCIAQYGISNGTSDLTFTPSGTVTRWQMALFLIRQVQVHGVVLPTAIDQGFVDVGGHDQETQDAIDQLAQLGITRGTGGGTFSPGEVVSRWEDGVVPGPFPRSGWGTGSDSFNNWTIQRPSSNGHRDRHRY